MEYGTTDTYLYLLLLLLQSLSGIYLMSDVNKDIKYYITATTVGILSVGIVRNCDVCMNLYVPNKALVQRGTHGHEGNIIISQQLSSLIYEHVHVRRIPVYIHTVILFQYRNKAAIILAFVSGFKTTSFAPEEMKRLISSGSAFPVTPDSSSRSKKNS